jgi:hypothetical protein
VTDSLILKINYNNSAAFLILDYPFLSERLDDRIYAPHSVGPGFTCTAISRRVEQAASRENRFILQQLQNIPKTPKKQVQLKDNPAFISTFSWPFLVVPFNIY